MRCHGTTEFPQFEDASIIFTLIDVSSRYGDRYLLLVREGWSLRGFVDGFIGNCEGVANVGVDHVRMQ